MDDYIKYIIFSKLRTTTTTITTYQATFASEKIYLADKNNTKAQPCAKHAPRNLSPKSQKSYAAFFPEPPQNIPRNRPIVYRPISESPPRKPPQITSAPVGSCPEPPTTRRRRFSSADQSRSDQSRADARQCRWRFRVSLSRSFVMPGCFI